VTQLRKTRVAFNEAHSATKEAAIAFSEAIVEHWRRPTAEPVEEQPHEKPVPDMLGRVMDAEPTWEAKFIRGALAVAKAAEEPVEVGTPVEEVEQEDVGYKTPYEQVVEDMAHRPTWLEVARFAAAPVCVGLSLAFLLAFLIANVPDAPWWSDVKPEYVTPTPQPGDGLPLVAGPYTWVFDDDVEIKQAGVVIWNSHEDTSTGWYCTYRPRFEFRRGQKVVYDWDEEDWAYAYRGNTVIPSLWSCWNVWP